MKKLMDRLTEIMSRPKFEKIFMVALPCLAVAIAVLMLVPQLRAFMGQMEAAYIESLPTVTEQPRAAAVAPAVAPFAVNTIEAVAEPEESAAPSPTPSPAPTASPTPIIKKATKLDSTSIENDLYIKVLDSDGKRIYREGIGIHIEYPGGESCDFATDSEGACYLVDLYAGQYTVAMLPHEEFEPAKPISCNVKEQVEYKPIDNIAEIVIIQSVTDMYPDALEDNEHEATLIPEVIETPEEATGENTVIVEETPVVDENGNQTYSYSFKTGPNGFLLLRGTETESNVLPVDEDGNGLPEYGLCEESEGYYVSIMLYNADNSPVEDYEVEAVPLVEEKEIRVGWQSIDGNSYYYANGVPVKGLNEIDGKLHYFDQFGVKAEKIGIDVSFYNEYIDWQQVKANGIDFAILRVGGRSWEQGNLYYDSRFKEYLSGAKAAGVQVGVYFYSTAINEKEAVEEASVTLDLIGGASLDYPVFIDMEYSGMYPDARMDKLTIPERSEIANAFCQTIINSGYKAGVYSGQFYYEDCMDFNAISQYSIWLASYTTENRLPSYKNRYDIWQFTDSGKVRGIEGGVDMNVIF